MGSLRATSIWFSRTWQAKHQLFPHLPLKYLHLARRSFALRSQLMVRLWNRITAPPWLNTPLSLWKGGGGPGTSFSKVTLRVRGGTLWTSGPLPGVWEARVVSWAENAGQVWQEGLAARVAGVGGAHLNWGPRFPLGMEQIVFGCRKNCRESCAALPAHPESHVESVND